MKKQIVLAVATLAACSSRQAPPPVAPQPVESSQMTGGLEHGMLNCPSAVDGAETRLRMTERGVDIFVRAKDPEARAEIAKLAERHTRMDRLTGWPEHTGKHGGPGEIGHCPIIHKNTQITLETVDDGVVLHVIATLPDRAKQVQEQTVLRLASLPRWRPRSASR
jgi:TusA-related sulfurtransferase